MSAWTQRTSLRHASAQPQSARLRELQGADELAVSGVDTRAGVQLLDRLLDAPPCGAAQLSASDRDALLASLHRALWGDRIVSSLECTACGAMYDLSFELSALQRQLAQQSESMCVRAQRAIEDAGGERFQLPSADDEDTAAQCGIEDGCAQLLASVCGHGQPDTQADSSAVSKRLEALAPMIDVDLDTACAECGHAALARFDIQSFVLQRLLDERDSVLGDAHTLASGYGWSLHDILSLTRSMRRSLAHRLTGAHAAFG